MIPTIPQGYEEAWKNDLINMLCLCLLQATSSELFPECAELNIFY